MGSNPTVPQGVMWRNNISHPICHQMANAGMTTWEKRKLAVQICTPEGEGHTKFCRQYMKGIESFRRMPVGLHCTTKVGETGLPVIRIANPFRRLRTLISLYLSPEFGCECLWNYIDCYSPGRGFEPHQGCSFSPVAQLVEQEMFHNKLVAAAFPFAC